MDFFEKIGDAISTKGKEAADKAKEVAEIVNLKSKISAQEDIIKKNFTELGKLYYEQYADMPDAPFGGQCLNIKKAQDEIKELQAKIKELKGI